MAGIFIVNHSIAQHNNIPVKLKVYSFIDNQELEGVHVIVNEILRAITNARGDASLQVRPDDTILLSIIGFEIKEISVIDISWTETNNIYLIQDIITLPGLTVESTWLETDVLVPLRRPVIVDGLNDRPIDFTPIKAGTIVKGYDPAVMGPSYLILGPFTYFSNKERQKRKLVRAIKKEELNKLKDIILADADIRASFLNIYQIDDSTYDEFLGHFNFKFEDTSFLSAYDLIESMHLEIKNYLFKDD